jgi:hypothetical protein
MIQKINIKRLISLTLVFGLFFVVGGCLKKAEVKPVVVEKKQEIKKDEKVVEKVEEEKKDEVNTSDWLTYEGHSAYNENIKFTIKIPNAWDFRYKVGEQWKQQDNVVYAKEFGPTACFMVLGAGGHGLNDYKIIDQKELEIANKQALFIKRINGKMIEGVISFDEQKDSISFEYFMSDDLIDTSCEKDILNIISTYQN